MHTLTNTTIQNKIIFLRVDYNLPFKNNAPQDLTKIKLSLKTINHLLKHNNKIILATHLGRPEGKFNNEFSTKHLLKPLQSLLANQKIIHLPDCIGNDVKTTIQNSQSKIFLLENLRFYHEEEQDDPTFAQSLASLADIYINDAFAVSHRAHASVHAITEYLPSYAGFQLETEVTELRKALYPQQPSIWIIGGAKLDKIDLINQALQKAEYILIGGALAFAFLRAKNISVGQSKTDTQSIHIAKSLLASKHASKIILPLDFITTTKMSPNAKISNRNYNELPQNEIALDLGPKTISLFKHYLRKAHTIVWNGPLGYYEWNKFAQATKDIGRFIGSLTAHTLVGGGETSDAMHKFHLHHKLTHVSTGGGASLEFLSGKILPGIQALNENEKLFRN
jgi:3-phosphoglycerate kinase